jgi:hypothetical protein
MLPEKQLQQAARLLSLSRAITSACADWPTSRGRGNPPPPRIKNVTLKNVNQRIERESSYYGRFNIPVLSALQ